MDTEVKIMEIENSKLQLDTPNGTAATKIQKVKMFLEDANGELEDLKKEDESSTF